MEDSDRVYVSPSIQKERPICFKWFSKRHSDGKHEFHGTVQIVYQNSTNPLKSKSSKIERNQNKEVDLYPFPTKEIIPKPLPPKPNYQETESTSSGIGY